MSEKPLLTQHKPEPDFHPTLPFFPLSLLSSSSTLPASISLPSHQDLRIDIIRDLSVVCIYIG